MKAICKIGILLFIFILTSGPKAKSMTFFPHKDESVKKETRSVGSFSGIKVGGAFEVFIKQTGTPGVVVEADAEIISYITTEVDGDILKIGMKSPPHHSWNNTHTLHVYITVAELKSVELSGAVEIKTETEIKGEKMAIGISGAVEAELNLNLQNLDIEISGACELELKGQAQEVNIEASGASELSAFDFNVKVLGIFASGATEAQVNASETLKISASGACEVRYKGGASVNAHTSGASSVKHED